MHKNGFQAKTQQTSNNAEVKIAVIGSGYVGLVIAACFAELGHTVTCIDSDKEKISALKQGIVPIHEEMLPELIARHRNAGLTFTSSIQEAVETADVVFIAVGTPAKENGETDLSQVEQAVKEIARHAKGYTVVVEKSTVPVTTCDAIADMLERGGLSKNSFDVVSNPEFLREGTALVDFLHADRIIVGTASDRAYALVERIYRPLTSGAYFANPVSIPGARNAENPTPLLRTTTRSSELIKHASNAFLSMKISFINSVANMCEAVEADITEVARGIGMDQRIGDKFLSAGIGYGGSCFHKDMKSFRAIGRKSGVDLGLLAEVERINEAQKDVFLHKVRSRLQGLKGKRLAVLGLAFKGGTDDVRESPAICLVRTFLEEGCEVAAYDPVATHQARGVLPAKGLTLADNAYQAMTGADALVILTDWPEFLQLDFTEVKQRLENPWIFDGRNMLDPAEMARLGLEYISMGRPPATPVQKRAIALKKAATKKRALVTGAAGFLGSHMVDALVAEGYSVVGVDNFLTGRKHNLEHLRSEPAFELMEHDITLPFDPGKVDLVFNMASPASPVDYTVHGVETLLVGSQGTRNALEIARTHKAAFLHCSTSECYGDPLVHPQPESYWGNVNPIGPRSVYDEAKRFSEALIMAYHRYYSVDTRLVRIFNTYGPRLQLNDGRVISNFLRQALRGEDLTVYGDGSQTRSFCYISDQIEGMLRLIRSGEHLPVNIGNPEEFTILDCAQKVLAVTGSKSKIVFRPLPQDDPKQRCPDISRARKLLGWEPKVKLAEGLRLSIPWFRENIQLEPAAYKPEYSTVAARASMVQSMAS